MSTELKTELVVIGSGPGGYTAAFRAADLGKKVILIERHENIGGVCLNVGCIPSKALLHAAKVLDEAHDMAKCGIEFGKPKIDSQKLRDWKNKIVTRLTGGLKTLAKQRKVDIIQGAAQFISKNQIAVETSQGKQIITFDHAIIAVGSRPVQLPFLPDDPRIIDSTGALELEETKGNMLIIGGGIIGLEMATVYHALGVEVTIVELMDQIIPGCDKDVVMPLFKRIQKLYKNILLKTKVTKVDAKKDGLWVTFEGDNAPDASTRFDRILCAVGRRPNGDQIAADKAGVKVDERGFIPVDKQQRTNVPTIFAIGDVTGNPMLAHKAIPEGRVAAEVIAGLKHYFDVKCIPSVAYTDPEIAWVGLTENEAKAKGIQYGKGVFPWAASGRALSIGRDEGLTKLLIDEKTHRVIGGAATGPNAGELVGEIGLAIEMGCDVGDISLTIHPHPTLSETIAMAAEVFEETITDLYLPKKH
ncbi:MAG: dihydrolipoamide dehydrogenase [Gammaproteobacteria bacterium]|jgi:dihydrolipoamide dehydrogenase|nr:dihydrolipoamide dehydrogenase [Gammaproteobacteria bacterium]MCE3237349.1 dihydrolipoamide dehydrogenase [Gammaproteobacteria bacterium]